MRQGFGIALLVALLIALIGVAGGLGGHASAPVTTGAPVVAARPAAEIAAGDAVAIPVIAAPHQ